MIFLYEEGRELPLLPSTYCSVFILSRALAYGTGTAFAPFYGDEKGNVLSILDGHAVLFCSKADAEEWITFIHMRTDIMTLTVEKEIGEWLSNEPGFSVTCRSVMRLGMAPPPPADDLCELSPREVYPVLQAAFGDNAPPFDGWYVDISHRLRHGLCHMAAIRFDDQPVSAAMTVAECEHTAVIGGVCTLPEYRRQGLAGRCVLGLSSKILKENPQKAVLISPKNSAAERLYQTLGFITEATIYSFEMK
ncbi:MAG: GNAT family N-acetyltransferase [Clostridia bacterium]|nr:GNAT family N-acetyltransferase [Clostridia bacterium]